MNADPYNRPVVDEDFDDESDEGIEEIKSLEEIERLLQLCQDKGDHVVLSRESHKAFLLSALTDVLDSSHISLDGQRSWLMYHCVQGLALLSYTLPESVSEGVVKCIESWWNPDGGISGGAGQSSHLLSTYALMTALVVMGSPSALHLIERMKPRVVDYVMSCKTSDGAFSVEKGACESDLRAIYGAVVIASYLNLSKDEMNRMFAGTAEFIVSCQSYEGGFGGIPNAEAHGGYTYCALSALALLNKLPMILDATTNNCLAWLTRRQSQPYGGFEGRANKSVDVCYSFWQGASLAILGGSSIVPSENGPFDRLALQRYILAVSQSPNDDDDGQQKHPGLRDKPDREPDHYHTCYGLAGLSIAQHRYVWFEGDWKSHFRCSSRLSPNGNPLDSILLGHLEENTLPAVHPLFNVTWDAIETLKSSWSL